MLPNGVYTLRGGRGSKLCADEGNRVICNRDAVGAWEKFTINKEGNKYSLRGGRTVNYVQMKVIRLYVTVMQFWDGKNLLLRNMVISFP